MYSMDSRVEFIDDSLQRLRTEQAEKSQRIEATRQSTTILKQRLQEVEARRQHEAAQHQAEMKNQKAHIAWLSGMINSEVKAHQEANAALQKAKVEQSSLKGEVAALSQELKATLA